MFCWEGKEISYWFSAIGQLGSSDTSGSGMSMDMAKNPISEM